jgi:hypothetical protein
MRRLRAVMLAACRHTVLFRLAYDVDLGTHTLPAHALRIASTDTGQSSNFCLGSCTCSLKNHADVLCGHVAMPLGG